MSDTDPPSRRLPWLARQAARAGGGPGAALWGFSLLLSGLAVFFAELARLAGTMDAIQGAAVATVVSAAVWLVGAAVFLRRASAALHLMEHGRLTVAQLDSRVLQARSREGSSSRWYCERFVFQTATGERRELETRSPTHAPLAQRQPALYLPDTPEAAELLARCAVALELVDGDTVRVRPRWWYLPCGALPWLALAGIGVGVWRLVGS